MFCYYGISHIKSLCTRYSNYLHKNGNYEITFICDYDDDFEAILPDYIKYIPVPMKRGISFSGIKALFKIFRIFKGEKFDMVQYSTPNASCYASIAAKLLEFHSIILSMGDCLCWIYWNKRRIFRLIEKTVCSLSTWIEPDSLGNLKFSHEQGLYKGDKSSVVWNGSASGVNLQKFNIQHKEQWRSEIRKKYGISKDTFVIGFVGRITRDKGINELYAACKSFIRIS